VHGATLDAALFHVSDEAVDIVAHEVELVENTIGFWILAVDDRVRTDDHGRLLIE